MTWGVEKCLSFPTERCESGRFGTPGERVYRKVPWVRIPPSPFFLVRVLDGPVVT